MTTITTTPMTRKTAWRFRKYRGSSPARASFPLVAEYTVTTPIKPRRTEQPTRTTSNRALRVRIRGRAATVAGA